MCMNSKPTLLERKTCFGYEFADCWCWRYSKAVLFSRQLNTLPVTKVCRNSMQIQIQSQHANENCLKSCRAVLKQDLRFWCQIKIGTYNQTWYPHDKPKQLWAHTEQIQSLTGRSGGKFRRVSHIVIDLLDNVLQSRKNEILNLLSARVHVNDDFYSTYLHFWYPTLDAVLSRGHSIMFGEPRWPRSNKTRSLLSHTIAKLLKEQSALVQAESELHCPFRLVSIIISLHLV